VAEDQKKFVVMEKYNQDPDLHGSALAQLPKSDPHCNQWAFLKLINDLGLDRNPDSDWIRIQESLDPNPYPDSNNCLGSGDPKHWTNHKVYYADGPVDGFPRHRPQELVGRCRLGTTFTKTVLLAWLNK
jgi:hypothetical protein